MKSNAVLRRWFMLACAAACPSAYADTIMLRHDPFARPALAAMVTGGARTEGTPAAEVAPWNPQLTAVMLAGDNSMVTVDGVIIKLGEEANGYRLVQVRDQEAVFRKGKKRIVLNMRMPTFKRSKDRGGQ